MNANKIGGQILHTSFRPTIYRIECLVIKKQYMHKMNVIETSILRQMCCKTRKDKIKNECFREH